MKSLSHYLTCYYCYYAAFNAPCVGHKDDESQAQMTNRACLSTNAETCLKLNKNKTKQLQASDSARDPQPPLSGSVRFLRRLFQANMCKRDSSTKPEAHDILQRRQRRAEPPT